MSETGSTHNVGTAVLRGVAGLAAATILWWLVTSHLATDGSMLARFRPQDAAQALAHLVLESRTWQHVATSLTRLAVGLGLAIALGLPLGIVIGSSKKIAEGVAPLFQFLRMISPLAWTPVAIMTLGVGNRPVYFLIVMAAVWPIIFNTAAGVDALAPGWRLAARTLGASRLEELRTIVLPGIRAHVTTGMRVALGISWIVLVPAEMLGVHSGLGYAVLDARDRLDYGELSAVIFLIGCSGFTVDTLSRSLLKPRRRPRPDPAQRQATARYAGGVRGTR